ncbi:hypothetical protein B0E49_11710 [Polaromonas sp. C04]|nr:hypothetical protein B0E49_11710 [Polaromonas sp. C04]
MRSISLGWRWKRIFLTTTAVTKRGKQTPLVRRSHALQVLLRARNARATLRLTPSNAHADGVHA